MRKLFLFGLMLWVLVISPDVAHGQGGPINTVSNITALVTRTPSLSNPFVYVLGYIGVSDWGDARLFAATTNPPSATNYGNVFRSNVRTDVYYVAEDRFASVQDVRWWGALPSDSVDDTIKLQSLMDRTDIKHIIFPSAGAEGLYNISGNGLVMSNVMWMQGDFRGSSKIAYEGTNWCLTISSGIANTQMVGPRVSELFFFGKTTAGLPQGILHIVDATRGTIDRCSFSWDRNLGDPSLGSRNIFLDNTAWIWSFRDNQIGYADIGVEMQCAATVGTLVSAIEFSGGEIFGNRYGVIIGSTNTASIVGGGRGMANIWFKNVTIEANGIGGAWINGAEAVHFGDWYTEANGKTSLGFLGNKSFDIQIGNDADTSTNFSNSSVTIDNVRFADSTNGIVLNSGEFITIANCMWTGGLGTNIIVSPNVRNSKFEFSNWSLAQGSRYPTIHDPGHVLWTERMGKDNDSVVSGATYSYPNITSQGNIRLGDAGTFDPSGRMYDMSRYIGVQTRETNELVGFWAKQFTTNPDGNNWYPGFGLYSDYTNVHLIATSESVTNRMMMTLEINGVKLLTLTPTNTFFPNKMGVALDYGTGSAVMDTSSSLSVGGGITILNQPHYYGSFFSRAPLYHLGFAVTNSTDSMGIVTLHRDADAHQFFIAHNPASNAVYIGTSRASGSVTPVIFTDPVNGAIFRIDQDGAWIGDRGTNLMSLGGGSGGTNASIVSIDGVNVNGPNFKGSVGFTNTVSGSNVTQSLVISAGTNVVLTTTGNALVINAVTNAGGGTSFTTGVGVTNIATVLSGNYIAGTNTVLVTNAFGQVSINNVVGAGNAATILTEYPYAVAAFTVVNVGPVPESQTLDTTHSSNVVSVTRVGGNMYQVILSGAQPTNSYKRVQLYYETISGESINLALNRDAYLDGSGSNYVSGTTTNLIYGQTGTTSYQDGKPATFKLFTADVITNTVTPGAGTGGSIFNNGTEVVGANFKGSANITNSLSSTNITLDLRPTTVTAGSYTNPVFTVDANGRLTAASSQALSGLTLVNGTLVTNINLQDNFNGKWIVSGTTNYTFVPQEAQTASGTSFTPDFAQGRVHKLTLTGNSTLNAPSNVSADMVDQTFTIVAIQDSTGNRTFTVATNYLQGTDITYDANRVVGITTNASYKTHILVYVRSTDVFDLVGIVRGYAP